MNPTYSLNRRNFLTTASSILLMEFMPTLLYADIIREIEGPVSVNRQPANLRMLVQPGDTIKTGPDGKVIFVIGQDVYQLGEQSTLQLEGSPKNPIVKALRLISGTLVGAFGSGPKRIQVPSAAIGIRGTGFFIQIQPHRTYFCTCYGKTELTTEGNQPQRQLIEASYHIAYSVIHDQANPQLVSDTMQGHIDEDLFYLESFVGRKPPETFKSPQ